jgi:predicted TIM-barrel fold metal-dependent hydrolase
MGLPVNAETLRNVARRIAPFGWHIAIWPANLAELQLITSLLGELPVPIVLDHLAGPAWHPARGVEQEGFTLLRSALATGRAWLKLSGMNRASSAGFPWTDLIPFGARLVRDGAERLLWASDWPHVGIYEPARMPHSGELLDWLMEIGCDPIERQRILVDNPAELFGFPPPR